MTEEQQRNTILDVAPLAMPWRTRDPFLFCVHHDDRYPAGNPELGPAAPLTGRDIGQDFAGRDGWSMYHGEVVPGFPQHPHRGFETVTFVRRGLVDHSDSLGATARYGRGDVQWLTAGSGIQHAEMFPLVDPVQPNPLELFQIWLNLPARNKMVPAHFSMFWDATIPRVREVGAGGAATEVTIVAGSMGTVRPPAPPPDSWASGDHGVAIWSLRLDAGARFALPAARAGLHRTLYFFGGSALEVSGRSVASGNLIELVPDREALLVASAGPAELLLLQGEPIAEPVASGGPFVMNTRQEIEQAYADFRRTGFGGWPWPRRDHVHPVQEGRFARHVDGRLERP